MLMSEKITLFIILWIIIMLFITGDAALEMFFILIFLGLIIAKELTDRYTVAHLKIRMNLFVLVFLLVFIVFMGKKIISFLVI